MIAHVCALIKVFLYLSVICGVVFALVCLLDCLYALLEVHFQNRRKKER